MLMMILIKVCIQTNGILKHTSVIRLSISSSKAHFFLNNIIT